MQVEWYEPTPTDIRRNAAFHNSPAGQALHKRAQDAGFSAWRWRVQHEGFVIPEEKRHQYEEWKATHPEPIP